jgi:HEAT repeat protein
VTQQDTAGRTARLRSALAAPDPSVRLRAALAAGTSPHADDLEVLVARCAVEPEFFVRDMLTWALTRHDPESTVDRLVAELGSPEPQARSQALHTLSKIGDRRVFGSITPALLHHADVEVARAAWRAAVALVPPGAEAGLAVRLASQLGRGDREVRLSLSRALVDLGEAGSVAVERATTHRDPEVRAHALATSRLRTHPDEGFDLALAAAERAVTLRGAPVPPPG